ncbi:MAG: YcxB family protein, partial [Clostridia bacterium]|nr:YcxB family protein [Clostridia bacterium]
IFDEGQVQISANGAGFDEKTNIAYDHLNRVIETKFSYLLYISQNMAYIILKSSLKPEEIPLLGAFLREKVGIQKYQSLVG